MLYGKFPFYDKNRHKLIKKIKSAQCVIPKYVPYLVLCMRPVRATITLYPIGRPVRATITLYPIGRPVRATITLYRMGELFELLLHVIILMSIIIIL